MHSTRTFNPRYASDIYFLLRWECFWISLSCFLFHYLEITTKTLPGLNVQKPKSLGVSLNYTGLEVPILAMKTRPKSHHIVCATQYVTTLNAFACNYRSLKGRQTLTG